MGSYVLYLLAQAFGAMVFAYLAGTLAFRDRKPSMVLVAVGLYLFMGAGLIELWGDRSSWTRTGLGLYAGIVSMGTCAVASGFLFWDTESHGRPLVTGWLAVSLLVAGAVTASAMVLSADVSTSVVTEVEDPNSGISGAYSELGPAGWALGCPLILAALLIVVVGLRAALKRMDPGAFWIVAAGVLYLVWPFDIWMAGLPLAPMFLLLAVAMTYLGYQSSRTSGEDVAGTRVVEGVDSEPMGQEEAPGEGEAATGDDESIIEEAPGEERPPVLPDSNEYPTSSSILPGDGAEDDGDAPKGNEPR